MAHPFKQHGEHRASKNWVNHILKSGGATHPDAAVDKKLFSSLMAGHEREEAKVEGSKGRSRFARGGRTKAKGHQTNIAIVVPQKGSSSSSDGPQAGPVPPPNPMAGPAPMPMPPGGPPGGAPPMPMRASGGRVGGDSTKANLDKWSKRAETNSYMRGGRLPTAGAESGVGRLQKAKK